MGRCEFPQLRFIGRMKAIAISMLAVCSLHAGESVADFRWKKRLLVVTQADEALGKQLAEAKPGLVERDVVVFVLRGPIAPPAQRPGETMTLSLRESLKLESEPDGTILLLGKDGRTTVRWKRETFSIQALFATIDAMPMRRREMNGK
jgi:hypothetical protein